jgi:hypothetical protein
MITNRPQLSAAERDAVDARLAAVDARLTDVDARLAATKTKLETAEASLAATKTKLESAEASIAALKAKLATALEPKRAIVEPKSAAAAAAAASESKSEAAKSEAAKSDAAGSKITAAESELEFIELPAANYPPNWKLPKYAALGKITMFDAVHPAYRVVPAPGTNVAACLGLVAEHLRARLGKMNTVLDGVMLTRTTIKAGSTLRYPGDGIAAFGVGKIRYNEREIAFNAPQRLKTPFLSGAVVFGELDAMTDIEIDAISFVDAVRQEQALRLIDGKIINADGAFPKYRITRGALKMK